jgi:hypothetical protein
VAAEQKMAEASAGETVVRKAAGFENQQAVNVVRRRMANHAGL